MHPILSTDPRARLLAGLPVAERRVELNGISTSVLLGGPETAPPLVLLHGPGEYAAKWGRVLPDLAATHRVIAPDLPGHGASEGAEAARVLGWLDALLASTCAAAPALLGHVLGGAIAARFAIARGEKIARLVLVDALGLASFQPAPEFGTALTAFLEGPMEETHDALWSRCAFDLPGLRHRLGERWGWMRAYNLDLARTPERQAALHALMEAFAFQPIPSEELGRISVPTTLIWGRHDLATDLAVAEQASARHGWPLHVIEEAGDDPAVEQPEAFVRALRTALQGA
jgi:pimeloyl-ACP methyl ester carboxylesterase